MLASREREGAHANSRFDSLDQSAVVAEGGRESERSLLCTEARFRLSVRSPPCPLPCAQTRKKGRSSGSVEQTIDSREVPQELKNVTRVAWYSSRGATNNLRYLAPPMSLNNEVCRSRRHRRHLRLRRLPTRGVCPRGDSLIRN
jgi:hypothetical protein